MNMYVVEVYSFSLMSDLPLIQIEEKETIPISAY